MLRHKKGELIAVIGLDGSGKTTLARGLVRRLRAEGRRAVRVHVWPTVPRLRSAGRATGLRTEPSRLPLWRTMGFGVLALLVLRVWLPWLLRRHDVVVCDRFVHDLVTYLRLRGREGAAAWLLRAGRPLEPEAIFRLRVPLDTLVKRAGEGLEHPPSVYARWAELYEGLIAEVPGWARRTHTLDGMQPPEALCDEALRRLRGRRGNRVR